MLMGHIPLVIKQLSQLIKRTSYDYKELLQICDRNKLSLANSLSEEKYPLTYLTAYGIIKQEIPASDLFIVSEGANSMDIARKVFDMQEPRCRLDAGN